MRAKARHIRSILYASAGLAAALAVVLFLLHAVPLTQQAPILSTRIADLYLACAATLLIVARVVGSEPIALLIPLAFSLAELANTAIQLLLRWTGVHVPTDPMLMPPLVIYLLLPVVYGAAYASIAGTRGRDR